MNSKVMNNSFHFVTDLSVFFFEVSIQIWWPFNLDFFYYGKPFPRLLAIFIFIQSNKYPIPICYYINPAPVWNIKMLKNKLLCSI